MYVNINGKAGLLRLQPYMVSRVIAEYKTEYQVLWFGLVPRVCGLRRVNLVEFHGICGKILYSNDWPIIFTDVCFITQNHGVISIF